MRFPILPASLFRHGAPDENAMQTGPDDDAEWVIDLPSLTDFLALVKRHASIEAVTGDPDAHVTLYVHD